MDPRPPPSAANCMFDLQDDSSEAPSQSAQQVEDAPASSAAQPAHDFGPLQARLGNGNGMDTLCATVLANSEPLAPTGQDAPEQHSTEITQHSATTQTAVDPTGSMGDQDAPHLHHQQQQAQEDEVVTSNSNGGLSPASAVAARGAANVADCLLLLQENAAAIATAEEVLQHLLSKQSALMLLERHLEEERVLLVLKQPLGFHIGRPVAAILLHRCLQQWGLLVTDHAPVLEQVAAVMQLQLSAEDESAPAEVAGLQCHVAYW
eukprot:gene6793-7010_t